MIWFRYLLLGSFFLSTYGATAQIDGFTNNFNYNDGTTYDATLSRQDMGDSKYWLHSQNSQIYDGNLRIRFEQGKFSGSCGIVARLKVNGDKVYSMEYRIKFDNGFDWKLGGKLPGLAGGTGPSGGGQPTDGNGFSTRYMWRQNGRLVVYAYYRDQPGYYGEDWDCNFTFETGKWYTLKQQVTVNSGNNADGRVEVWVDGVKKLDKGGIRLMTNNNTVDEVSLDTFMGGNDAAWSPDRTQYLRIDDVKVVKGGNPEPPTPNPGTGNVTVRARGTSGSEQIEVRYNDTRVGNLITLSTSFQEYKVQVDNPTGNFKVAFINDTGERDVVLDRLRVGSEQKEAEEQEVNTASWTSSGCGTGTLTQNMYCNGYIDFGNFGDSGDTNTGGSIVIRAKGDCGIEDMELRVDGETVKTWTNIATSFTDYTYNGFSGLGQLSVHFTNNDNQEASCADKNLEVDWINVCGTTYQTETQATKTSTCCAASKSKLYTNGNFNFASLSCGSAARTASGEEGKPVSAITGEGRELFNTYPNPASQALKVEGTADYQVTIYDMSGRVVMQHDHLKGLVNLNIRHLRPGLYMMRMRDAENYELHRRIVIE